MNLTVTVFTTLFVCLAVSLLVKNTFTFMHLADALSKVTYSAFRL